jgi:hypothetical protein
MPYKHNPATITLSYTGDEINAIVAGMTHEKMPEDFSAGYLDISGNQFTSTPGKPIPARAVAETSYTPGQPHYVLLELQLPDANA